MFNRFGGRFAYGFEGGNPEEGWTPPWLHHEREWRGPREHHREHGRHGGWGHHWRHSHEEHPLHGFMMRRRGPFGPQGPFGPEGPFGPQGHFGPAGPFGPKGPFGHGRRFFGRGDIKFALLELLQERPMYGYEMMKALEEKSGGFYAPSAGSIYPTLQMLEDRGFVTVSEVEGKKVYTITDAGHETLKERKDEQGEFFGPNWNWGPKGRGIPELQALRSEASELARLFAIAGRSSFSNPEQLARLRSIIERTRKELSDLIYTSGEKKAE